MKKVIGILLLITAFSCSQEDVVEQEIDELENEQSEEEPIEDETLEDGEELTGEKKLSKVIYEDGTFIEYHRNSEGLTLFTLDEKNQVQTENSYNSDNLNVFSVSYDYEDGIFEEQRSFYNTYDDQRRLLIREKETLDHEIKLKGFEVDSMTYEGRKIISTNYVLKNTINYTPEYITYIAENVYDFLEKEYDTEYYLNEDETLANLKSNQIFSGVVVTTSNLDFFYDEKLRCVRITGQYTDYEMVLHTVDVNVEYTDYLRKDSSNRLTRKNYLTSQSEPIFSEIFISNFIRNSSDYYLKNIKEKITTENSASEVEFIYNYEFDNDGYPTSLMYIPASGIISNTIYEWE